MGVRRGDLVRLPGESEWVLVDDVISEPDESIRLYVRAGDSLDMKPLAPWQVDSLEVLVADGQGDPGAALAGLWAHWLRHSHERLHPSALTVAPLKPYPHQNEAVYARMMPQARLRFLLADEPGTGKTIMSGLWLRESQRLGLVKRALVVCPAHLVTKWIEDIGRFLSAEMKRITARTAAEGQLSWDQCWLWVVSLDLAAGNPSVREALHPEKAGWDAVIFDEAHRLTPSAKTYHRLAAMLTRSARQALLLTATPHRGDENLFRSLMHLVDPEIFPEPEAVSTPSNKSLKPGRVHYLRRLKEHLIDYESQPLFRSRTAHNIKVPLSAVENSHHRAAMELVEQFFPSTSVGLARMVYGKRASSSLHALRETLRRRIARAGLNEPSAADTAGLHGDHGGDHAEDDTVAEAEVESVESTDWRAEKTAAEELASSIDELLHGDGYTASKWPQMVSECLTANGIEPGAGEQAVVFTEYADTADWLVERLRSAGFSAEMYSGRQSHAERDLIRQRFAAGGFEVFVTTDAGGEGINLQTAHVLVNWDIPWSLVRLEQRMGRIHRIGQDREVLLYNVVATGTREGDAMSKLLDNLVAAANQLEGKMFDSLRLVGELALTEVGAGKLRDLLKGCQADNQQMLAAVEKITAERLRQIYDSQQGSQQAASAVAFAADSERVLLADQESRVNPEVVERFGKVCRQAGLISFAASAAADRGCFHIGPKRMPLPESWNSRLDADGTCLVATRPDLGKATPSAARAVRLGPVSGEAHDLYGSVTDFTLTDVLRGATLWDASAHDPYTLCVYESQITEGARRRYLHSFLMRVDRSGAHHVDWASLTDLSAEPEPAPPYLSPTSLDTTHGFSNSEPTALIPSLPPTARLRPDIVQASSNSEPAATAPPPQPVDSDPVQGFSNSGELEAADVGAADHIAQVAARREDELLRSRDPFVRELRTLPSPIAALDADHQTRRALRKRAEGAVESRAAELQSMCEVAHTLPRRVGWTKVLPASESESTDPDSEQVAVALVSNLLRQEGFVVHDTQQDGCGYDLRAERNQTRMASRAAAIAPESATTPAAGRRTSAGSRVASGSVAGLCSERPPPGWKSDLWKSRALRGQHRRQESDSLRTRCSGRASCATAIGSTLLTIAQTVANSSPPTETLSNTSPSKP